MLKMNTKILPPITSLQLSRQDRISPCRRHGRVIINWNMVGGFTLIEALIAVAIFGVLLGGISTLAVYSLQFTDNYKNNVKAALLAQEGIELIRDRRDTNKLNEDNWIKDIKNANNKPCGKPDHGCIAAIDTTNGAVTFLDCSGRPLSFSDGISDCPFLKYDPVTKLYSNTGSQDTTFQRTIHVVELGPDPALRVQVMVTWTTRFGPRKLIVQDTFTDWQ